MRIFHLSKIIIDVSIKSSSLNRRDETSPCNLSKLAIVDSLKRIESYAWADFNSSFRGHFFLGVRTCTQRNYFEILLNHTEIRLYLPFPDWYGTKRSSVWFVTETSREYLGQEIISFRGWKQCWLHYPVVSIPLRFLHTRVRKLGAIIMIYYYEARKLTKQCKPMEIM